MPVVDESPALPMPLDRRSQFFALGGIRPEAKVALPRRGSVWFEDAHPLPGVEGREVGGQTHASTPAANNGYINRSRHRQALSVDSEVLSGESAPCVAIMRQR